MGFWLEKIGPNIHISKQDIHIVLSSYFRLIFNPVGILLETYFLKTIYSGNPHWYRMTSL